ncbi:hypothetical protein SAMN04515665_10618 [Blastococcus sp. DSM 46786]|uniref:DUF5701 family protein n=1 Tax=Blastococcus sp. DSM 46786 TaxID=1798227 RepID=UPI0008D58930|nr:DUF5701 family protein [Blastococcus sp. DSM 46786]SEK87867.1 hypothetical protein SAMN04515665_10618 [Blastococcus sp. DSM 46786]
MPTTPTAHPLAPLPLALLPAAPLPAATAQAERLIALGVPGIAGLDPAELHAAAGTLPPGALLVVHPDRAPVSALAPLLELDGRPGFVVEDMTDVDAFGPAGGVELPADAVYAVTGLDRGDGMRNWSPAEALPALGAAGRTPLTLGEGVHWLLQCPEVLERNACFMTVGSRLRKGDGRLDARTPALWISNGTGRDGRERRGAPKVGWCWAGNRHTWLGIASAAARVPR